MERHKFDENQPQGTMSLQNMRNTLRALHQGDVMALRPRASRLLDDMEYSTSTLAAAAFSGTGVTVTTDGTVKHDGNYAIKFVIDGTGSRQGSKTQSLILTGFGTLKFWDYVDAMASAYQFFLRDASGNESYWDCTTHTTQETWKQQTCDLSSPDSNNGSNASLSTITSWGFKGLDASRTYHFDNVEAVCGLKVFVESALIADYYAPIYIGDTHLSFAGGASPVMVPPSANPRIDVLTIDSTGTLAWTTGTEASSPVEPTYPAGKIPIALVYCKTTMTKVVAFEDAAANPNEAYIYRDVRPLFLLGVASFRGLTDAFATFVGKSLYRVRVNTGETALEAIADTLLNLSDVTDANYTGKAGKVLAVNTGETGTEFITRDAYYA